MFRKINIKDNKEDIKVYLYRNRREILGEIPSECIKKITRNLEDIDTIEIEIPKYIMKNGEKIFNSIYNKVLPKQQIVAETTTGDEVKKERFTLLNKSRKNNKKTGTKKFKAYSFEYTLKTKRCEFPSTVIQLKSDETHVASGIMDVIAEKTDWKIGYVDPEARTETMSVIDSVNYNLFKNFSKDNIEEEGLIFDVNYETYIKEGKPLYLEISYINMKTYSGETLLKTEEIINYITEPIAKNIKRIRAYHYTNTGTYRYGIKYVFTTVDNVEVERFTTFTNVVNKSITADEIKIRWETSELITKENIKYIQIETADDNYYDFLRDVQDQFNALFIFDSWSKTVSCISRKNIGKESNFMLSYDSNVLEINVEEQSEYPNALKVISGNVSISSENIYGGDTIFNFKWYKDNGIMSEELADAYEKYEELLSMKQDEWYTLRNNLMDVTQRKTAIDSEIKSLDYRIKYYKNLLVGFIAANDSSPQQEQIKTEIDALELQLTECLAKRKEYEDQITEYEDEMLKISNDIKMENAMVDGVNIFTELDIQEYNDMLVYEVYNDEYYSTPYGLYNNSKLVLEDMIKPDINFTITTANLCKIIKHPKGFNWILGLGDLFTIDDLETISDVGEDVIRLISYDYIPSNNNVSNLVFTNKIHKISNTNKMSNIGKQTANNSNTINNFKELWEESQMQTNFVKNMIDGTLDATATAIRSRSSRVILDISDAGIFVSDATDSNKSLYLGCNTLAISEDGWKTSAVAINSNSVTADLVMGRLLLGNKLEITTDDGRFTIGLNEDGTRMGTHVVDEYLRERIFLGLERQSDGTQIAKLELKSADGQSVVLDENGIVSEFQFCDRSAVDSTAPMRSYFRIQDNVNILKECILTVKLLPFRVHSKGMEGGGGYVQGVSTLSGGGSTSESGGGYNNVYAVTSGGENWTNPFDNYIWTTLEYLYGDDNSSHYHGLDGRTLRHTHLLNFNINVPAHSHFCPNHTHQTNLNIPSHVHPEKYGCFDLEGNDNIPSDVSLKVNGQTIRQNINSDFEINITSYLVKGKMNNIELSSATRGQIYFNLYCKSFVLW